MLSATYKPPMSVKGVLTKRNSITNNYNLIGAFCQDAFTAKTSPQFFTNFPQNLPKNLAFPPNLR
jgi:hypothetical protein